jgi:hypothetical protein
MCKTITPWTLSDSNSKLNYPNTNCIRQKYKSIWICIKNLYLYNSYPVPGTWRVYPIRFYPYSLMWFVVYLFSLIPPPRIKSWLSSCQVIYWSYSFSYLDVHFFSVPCTQWRVPNHSLVFLSCSYMFVDIVCVLSIWGLPFILLVTITAGPRVMQRRRPPGGPRKKGAQYLIE